MRTDGSGERLISSGGKDEGPTWAPNGRVLMYRAARPGGARLADLVGGCDRA